MPPFKLKDSPRKGPIIVPVIDEVVDLAVISAKLLLI